MRSEDRPLHEDMRYLAGVLGRVVERLQGPDTFRAVEDLRTASRDRRRGDANAETLEQMLEKVDALLQVSDFKLARNLIDEDQARHGDDLTPPWPDLRQSYRLIADCRERPGDPKPRVFAQAFVEVSEAAALVPKIRAACAHAQ